MRYTGDILGFHYDIVKDTDKDFEDWLEAKLKKYVLGTKRLKVLEKILRLDIAKTKLLSIEARLDALESP